MSAPDTQGACHGCSWCKVNFLDAPRKALSPSQPSTPQALHSQGHLPPHAGGQDQDHQAGSCLLRSLPYSNPPPTHTQESWGPHLPILQTRPVPTRGQPSRPT